ncbi:MAG: prolyl oligopeptidase family serine peptidase, partial [Halioglobus sp.]|nr:prolyl oligopeptidase family serine peptidase [Halioglobus sp.]
YNPMLDLSPGTPDHHLVKDHWQAVSPYHHIDAGFPPTLIMSGTRDPEVPVATVEAFCAAVRAAGGRCELELYEGQGHGFYHFSEGRNPWFERSARRALAFLNNLKG